MAPWDANIRLCKYCGIWRPQEWTSGWKFWLYNIYTAIAIFMVFSMPLAQCIELILGTSDDETWFDNIYMIMLMMATCAKILTAVLYRPRINKLLATFESDNCRVKNLAEQTVQQNYNRLMQLSNRAYGLMMAITIIGMTITWGTLNIPKKTVPYKMWLPFNVTTNTVYGLVFTEEYISMSFGSFISIGFDTFLFGIILQTCGQFELLKCRIPNIVAMSVKSSDGDELNCFNSDQDAIMNNRIADCVQYHLLIYHLVDEVSCIFELMILLNYTTSTITLCVTVFRMSQIESFTLQQVSLMGYITVYVVHLSFFCYIGSELSDKSRSIGYTIYDINWHTLSTSDKKSMLVMMSRSLKPVIITSGKVFQMSVDCIVKTAQFTYSAYTCLKQIS